MTSAALKLLRLRLTLRRRGRSDFDAGMTTDVAFEPLTHASGEGEGGVVALTAKLLDPLGVPGVLLIGNGGGALRV
jgi:hypothetical protein